MAQFKTRYVGELYRPQTTAGDVIEKTFQGVGAAMQGVAQQRQKAINETVERYGLDQPIKTAIPTGLNKKFTDPAQQMLNQLQKTAAEAKLNPSANNLDAYTRAKTDYEDFLKVATAVSQTNNNTVVNINSDKVKGMAVTKGEAIDLFNAQDTVGKVEVVNGQVTINGQYWRSTDIADVTNVFAPPVLSETTKYAADVFGEQIVADIGNKAENFATTEQAFGRSFTTGIDEAKLTNHVAEKVKAMDRNNEFNQAIAFNAYSKTLGSDTPFTSDKESEALTQYNPSYNDATVTIGGIQKRIGEIQSISPDGTVVYAVSDEQVAALPNATDLTKWRQSKSEYVKELYTATKNNMPIKDESSDYDAYRKEKARAESEARAEKAESQREATAKALANAPAFSGQSNNWTLPNLDLDVSGTKIVSVAFNNNGDIVSYTVKKEKTTGELAVPGVQPIYEAPKIVTKESFDNNIITALQNEDRIQLAYSKIKSVNADPTKMKAVGVSGTGVKSVSSQQADYAPFNTPK